jgi:hypothetical protein
MTNVSIETKSRALKLRAILNQLSNVSYSFARLNKDYPFDHLDERDLRRLIDAYEELMETAAPLVRRYDNEKMSNGSQSQQRREVGTL